MRCASLEVHSALVRIGRFLSSREARVGYAYLPSKNNGDKVGLDDFFVAGGKVQELERYVYRDPLREPEDESDGPDDGDGEEMQVYQLVDVITEDYQFGWLVEGWWPHPYYGQLAGAEKTLKSYVSTLLALAIASGRPFLGSFPVRTSGPVLVFTGEGSRHLWRRRAEHLAAGMNMTPDEVRALPIRLIDDVAQIKSKRFQRTLDKQLNRDPKPVLVIVDPLYAYHGSKANAGNLHEVADVLDAVGCPAEQADVSLIIVNHFTKAAREELSLSSITWAGAREWSGAWCLMKHAKAPDLEKQQASLDILTGSREGNGDMWRLDVNLGPLDRQTLRHQGLPSCPCARRRR